MITQTCLYSQGIVKAIFSICKYYVNRWRVNRIFKAHRNFNQIFKVMCFTKIYHTFIFLSTIEVSYEQKIIIIT